MWWGAFGRGRRGGGGGEFNWRILTEQVYGLAAGFEKSRFSDACLDIQS